MKAPQKRTATGRALKSLAADCISERSGDTVYSNYWIKVGLPRAAVTKLTALGQKLGFQKAPTAAAVRLITLTALLHPKEVEQWIADVRVKHPCVLPLATEHKGSDPLCN